MNYFSNPISDYSVSNVITQLESLDLDVHFPDKIDRFMLLVFYTDFLVPRFDSSFYNHVFTSQFFEKLFTVQGDSQDLVFCLGMIKKILFSNIVYIPEIEPHVQTFLLKFIGPFIENNNEFYPTLQKELSKLDVSTIFDNKLYEKIFLFLFHLDIKHRKNVKMFFNFSNLEDVKLDYSYINILTLYLQKYNIYYFNLEKEYLERMLDLDVSPEFDYHEHLYIPSFDLNELSSYMINHKESVRVKNSITKLKTVFSKIIKNRLQALLKNKSMNQKTLSPLFRVGFHNLLNSMIKMFVFYPDWAYSKGLYETLFKEFEIRSPIFWLNQIEYLENLVLTEKLTKGTFLFEQTEFKNKINYVKFFIDDLANTGFLNNFVSKELESKSHLKLFMNYCEYSELFSVSNNNNKVIYHELDPDNFEILSIFQSMTSEEDPKEVLKKYSLAYLLSKSEYLYNLNHRCSYFLKCKKTLEALGLEHETKVSDFPFIHDFKIKFKNKFIFLNLKTENKMRLGEVNILTQMEQIKNFFFEVENCESLNYIHWLDLDYFELNDVDFKAYLFEQLDNVQRNKMEGMDVFLNNQQIFMNELKDINIKMVNN
jgi:hypothetical protein